MGLNANKVGGGNKEQKQFGKQPTLEAGVYPGRLVQIIDLGLQPQRAFKQEPKAPAQEVMFTYELSDAFMLDEEGKELEDKPRWISETLPFYGLYADRAKSTQRIKAMDPNDDYKGDVSRCIATPLNITITISPNAKNPDKPYENVANVAGMRPRDAAKLPELKNPPKVFDLDNPDMEVFNKLPEWIREKIKGNLNFKGSKLEGMLDGNVTEAGNINQDIEQADVTDGPPWEENDAPY